MRIVLLLQEVQGDGGGRVCMTPKEATEFRKACNAIRKHIPDDNETPAMFELVVLRIVGKVLEAL